MAKTTNTSAAKKAASAGAAPTKPAPKPGKVTAPAAPAPAPAATKAKKVTAPAAPAPAADDAGDDADLDLDEPEAADDAEAGDDAGLDEAGDADTEAGDDTEAADTDAADDTEAEAGEDAGDDAPADAADDAPTEGDAPEAADEAPAEGDGDEYPLDEKFSQVLSLPIDTLKPGKLRVPTEAQIDAMALSIRRNGLQNPIIVSEDGFVIAGNTRVAAYKKLGKDRIPARVATDPKTGNPLKFKDHAAVAAAVIENVVRSDLTPIQLGNAYARMLKSGVAENTKALATMLGISHTMVGNTIAVAQKGTKALHAALEAEQITKNGAIMLLQRTGGGKALDTALAELIAAAEGKPITREDVDKKHGGSPRRSKSGKRKGRTPSSVPVAPEHFGADGRITARLRKGADGNGFTVDIVFSIDHDGDNFTRFDLQKKIQAAATAMDGKEVRTGLENARKHLLGK